MYEPRPGDVTLPPTQPIDITQLVKPTLACELHSSGALSTTLVSMAVRLTTSLYPSPQIA